MHRSPDRFWSLPELREQVCSYLNNRSLASLRLVSKALHATCHPFFRLQVNAICSSTRHTCSETRLPPDYLMESSGHNVNALVMEIPSSMWPQPRNMLPWHQYLDDETGSITGLHEMLDDLAEEETDLDLVPNVKDLFLKLRRYQPTILTQMQETLAKFSHLTTLSLIFDSHYEELLGPEFDVLIQDRPFCARLESLTIEGMTNGLVWRNLQRLLKSTVRLRSLTVRPISFIMENKDTIEWKRWARQLEPTKASTNPSDLDLWDASDVERSDSLLYMPQLTTLQLLEFHHRPLRPTELKQGLGLAFPNLEQLEIPSLSSIWNVGYKPLAELFPKLRQLTFYEVDDLPTNEVMLNWIQDYYQLHCHSSSSSQQPSDDPHSTPTTMRAYRGPILKFHSPNLCSLKVVQFFKDLEALPPLKPARFHTLAHDYMMFPDKVLEGLLASPVCEELRVLDVMSFACATFVEHYLEWEVAATDTNSSTNTTTEHPSIEAHPQQWRMRLPFANTLTGLHLGGRYFRSREEEHILGLGRLTVFLSFLPELVDLTIRWKMSDLRVFDRLGRRLVEGHVSEGLQYDKDWSRNERPLLERLHIWVYDQPYTLGYIAECKQRLRYKFRLLEDLSVQEYYS